MQVAIENEKHATCLTAGLEGELDPNWHGHYLENDKFKMSKVLHGVTQDEAQRWHSSHEVQEWASSVEARMLVPSYYWTRASED